MKKGRFLIPAMILAGGVTLLTTTSFGKSEYTKKEKTPCTTCHVTAKSKDLNDVGKCYQKSKELAGCKAPEKK